jgi:Rrf2 family protein
VFNRETEYSIRALVYIKVSNLKGRLPGSAEISVETDAPHFYISKILQKLVRAGVIGSVKGKGGGFFFDKNKPDISLEELIVITEGSKRLYGCGFGFSTCSDDNPCPIHNSYSKVRSALLEMVKVETIGTIASRIAREDSSSANSFFKTGSTGLVKGG